MEHPCSLLLAHKQTIDWLNHRWQISTQRRRPKKKPPEGGFDISCWPVTESTMT